KRPSPRPTHRCRRCAITPTAACIESSPAATSARAGRATSCATRSKACATTRGTSATSRRIRGGSSGGGGRVLFLQPGLQHEYGPEVILPILRPGQMLLPLFAHRLGIEQSVRADG